MACDQCGGTRPTTPTEYGNLCQVCAYHQQERDDARDRFEHLSAQSLGFRYDDE